MDENSATSRQGGGVGDARATILEDLEQLQRRARGDRRATSSPLLVFGLVTLLGVPFADDLGRGSLYWLLAVPAGFAFLAWRRRLRAGRTGVGEGNEPYGWFALGFWLLLLVPFGLFLVLMAPTAAVTAGLLAVAWRQRNRYLAVCAAVFGLVGALEVPFSVISNRIYELNDALGVNRDQYGYVRWSQQLVVGLMAAFFLGAGALARRRERRAA